MEWLSIEERKPTKEDSPILACTTPYLDYFNVAALHWLEDGWDGPGWYDHSDEYGMWLNEDEAHFCETSELNKIKFWMPLPKPPQ